MADAARQTLNPYLTESSIRARQTTYQSNFSTRLSNQNRKLAMRRNRKIKLILASLILLAGFSSRAAESAGQTDEQQLARQAVAILQARCVVCHGKDKESDLDLRTREGLLKGGSRGPAIKPGDAEESLLYRFISGEERPRMPMGEELSEFQIELLKQWIEKGAVWPKDLDLTPVAQAPLKPITDQQRNYWAFRKPARPPIPKVKDQAWVRTPVDAFILEKLEEKGLRPSPPADKRALLRRVTFDLTGLPLSSVCSPARVMANGGRSIGWMSFASARQTVSSLTLNANRRGVTATTL
jgi:mono/diheme cytochrome c family protein